MHLEELHGQVSNLLAVGLLEVLMSLIPSLDQGITKSLCGSIISCLERGVSRRERRGEAGVVLDAGGDGENIGSIGGGLGNGLHCKNGEDKLLVTSGHIGERGGYQQQCSD